MNVEVRKTFVISEEANVVDALTQIDLNQKGIVFVIDENEKIVGTLTDGDIRRWLIKTGKLDGCVKSLMNKNPKVIYRKDMAQVKEIMEKYLVTALPIVSTKGKILDIIFKIQEGCEENEEGESLEAVTVVIMAGGKGTRLYPYTKILPKPLIPIGDIPIMERIMGRFSEFGVKRFYATLNYRKNMIKSYFSEIETPYELHYVEEDKPLGTGGSLHLIEESIQTPLIVTNCDILIQANYIDIYEHHKNSGNVMTIVTALKNIVVPYGVINAKENGGIISMDEKPKLSYFINTGMYVINPELIQKIPKDTFYHMTDLASDLLAEGKQVGMYPISEDSFLDMGEFEEMHRMEKKMDLTT